MAVSVIRLDYHPALAPFLSQRVRVFVFRALRRTVSACLQPTWNVFGLKFSLPPRGRDKEQSHGPPHTTACWREIQPLYLPRSLHQRRRIRRRWTLGRVSRPHSNKPRPCRSSVTRFGSDSESWTEFGSLVSIKTSSQWERRARLPTADTMTP